MSGCVLARYFGPIVQTSNDAKNLLPWTAPGVGNISYGQRGKKEKKEEGKGERKERKN